MSKLRIALDEYLKVRRALGYKLRVPGGLLRRFVDFADRAGAEFITTELALKWAMQPPEAQPVWWAKRLGMVRQINFSGVGSDYEGSGRVLRSSGEAKA